MQISTRTETPAGGLNPSSLLDRTSPRVLTRLSDLTWEVFVQRRRRAQLRRRTFESVLFPDR